MVGVPSLIHPSISRMKSSGEMGGMIISFLFSTLSLAFPPVSKPIFSLAFLGIRIRPLLSMYTSCSVIFPTIFSPTVGNIHFAGKEQSIHIKKTKI